VNISQLKLGSEKFYDNNNNNNNNNTVTSASNRNEYQEHFLGVKAAGAYG
jgi:hypothetical protein